LRHRRRLTTQTIQRKNSTGTFQAIQKQNKSKAGKYFLIILILAAVISATYIYRNEIIDLLPVDIFNFSMDKSDQSAADKSGQPLPVEENTDEQVPPYTPIQKRVQVEVLNGCGVPGIAKKISDHLKDHNYDVVNSGNYLENGHAYFDVSKTKIIDQIKSQENIIEANKMADLLGINENLIESYENPSPIADLTLIIGKDYNQLRLEKD
jgi:hypothetical protein